MISIILPTYNREATLMQAIDSVLTQTFEDLELIIVDDGSTDNTENLLKNYTDSRIIYLKIAHGGANKARNVGIMKSSHSLIGFQDSDARWYPNKLQKQFNELQALSSEYAGLFSGAFIENKHGRKKYIPHIKVREGMLYYQLLHENFIDTPAMLLKKEALVDVGMFNEQLPRFQDWDLALRLSKKYRLFHINQALHTSFYGSNQISQNNKAGLKAKIYVFRTHYPEISKNNKTLANHYYSLGLSIAVQKHFSMAKKFFIKAVRLNTYHLKAWVSLLLAIFKKHR